MTEIKTLPPEELYGKLFYDVMSIDELFGKDKQFKKSDIENRIDEISEYFEVRWWRKFFCYGVNITGKLTVQD